MMMSPNDQKRNQGKWRQMAFCAVVTICVTAIIVAAILS